MGGSGEEDDIIVEDRKGEMTEGVFIANFETFEKAGAERRDSSNWLSRGYAVVEAG